MVCGMVDELIWKLRDVGYGIFFIGHLKTRTKTDPITGIEFDILTTPLSYKYDAVIMNRAHFASTMIIDRQIAQESVKQKVGADKIVGSITSEARVIKFRDDNYSVDVKSRFADIVPSVSLSVGNYIKAVTDAIESEHNKQIGAKSITETAREQAKTTETEIRNEVAKANQKTNEELIAIITKSFATSDDKAKASAKALMSQYNIKSFGSPDSLDNTQLAEIANVLS